MSATGKIWSLGKTWNVHVKHPELGWIRVTGFPTEADAIREEKRLLEALDGRAAS